MLEGFFGGDAFVGVVDEDLLEEGEELSIEVCVWRDYVLESGC